MNSQKIEMNISEAATIARKLSSALEQVIKGRGDTIRMLITALLADGHVLIEDYPGSGKTTLTKAMGRLIRDDRPDASTSAILPFRRIQFTPDMLPGDVLGVNIFEPKSANFRFLHGPIFAHVVLADEINRTGPKVQAAFLECMAEKQVTIDNVTYKLDDLFFVIGTQNPLDIAGTYPLPLVQLDRFLLKIPMSYVDADTELKILEEHHSIMQLSGSLEPVCSRSEILQARASVTTVHVSEHIRRAIVEIVQATRDNPVLQFGASTRAALMLQQASRSWALVEGRDFVTEDDLKTIAPYVLMHRLRFHGGIEESRRAFEELIAPAMERLASTR